MRIYIVFGSTGEYSDNIEWVVKAFKSADKALDLTVRASQEASRLYCEYENKWEFPEEGANIHDPKMQMDYNGTRYRYESCDLED